jgi:hypothetical protein
MRLPPHGEKMRLVVEEAFHRRISTRNATALSFEPLTREQSNPGSRSALGEA